jgi:hypothetical protein
MVVLGTFVFMLAETIVIVLVIFIPGLAAWLPHYFSRLRSGKAGLRRACASTQAA